MGKTEYELMALLFFNGDTYTATLSDSKYPNGVDSESCMVGDARAVIKYLLKHDVSMEAYKIVKKHTRKKTNQEKEREK